MCTALSFKTENNYLFGRTLDVCSSDGEKIVLTPENFPLVFRDGTKLQKHRAILGTACVVGGLPLYYDAMNADGLCMAGLNFPDNAVYHKRQDGKINVAPFEIILYILGKCGTLREARAELEKLNVCDISFSDKLPHTPLHWMIGDGTGELVAESVADGLKVYDNPSGVLTNNPPFPQQLFNLKNYSRLSPYNPRKPFTDKLDLQPYSRGMGALGLPGDWSSPSRFVRAAFVKFNYLTEGGEATGNDFFNMLDAVKVPNGCVEGANGFQYTVYSCCCDTGNLTYTMKTYGGAVHSADFKSGADGTRLITAD